MVQPPSRRLLTGLIDAGVPLLPASLREGLVSLVSRFMPCRVASYREWATRGDVNVYQFEGAGTFDLMEPVHAPAVPSELARIQGDQRCPQPFVMEVPNAVVSTDQGMIIPAEGTYLRYDYWRAAPDGRRRKEVARALVMGLRHGNLPNLRGSVSVNARRVERCVPLLATHAKNYTHWTQECLTQLPAIKAYEHETSSEPTILIPPDPPSFIPEALTHLGFSSERYRELEGGQIRSEKLVLPSMRRCWDERSLGFVRDPEALRWVRQRAVGNLPEEGQSDITRVFISREDASTRRITNRDEVENYLASRGFEKRVLSPLSYREQVDLFSRAEFVIGTHGAGMVNSLYTSEAPILELYGDHYLPANYEVAQAIGAPYGCLGCEPVGHDIKVNIDELAEAIEALESQMEQTV